MKKNRNESVVDNKRWSKYAAAAAAGAVTVLGTQATVDADLTVIDVNTALVDAAQDGYFTVFGPYTFGGAGASFDLRQAFNETASGEGQMLVYGFGNISFVGAQNGAYFYPSNLPYGQNVSTAGPFSIAAGDRGDMAWGAGYGGSNFLGGGTSYLGFRFDIGNGTQYGWAEIDMNAAPVNTGTFVRYGWGGPGEQVFAGVSQIPEPGSLGMLALGSVGILAWRRRKSDAA